MEAVEAVVEAEAVEEAVEAVEAAVEEVGGHGKCRGSAAEEIGLDSTPSPPPPPPPPFFSSRAGWYSSRGVAKP